MLNLPAGHRDVVALMDPGGHAKPAAQGPLQLAESRPDVPPNSPAGHSPEHASVDKPDVSPYRPMGQSVHTPAPDSEYLPGAHTAAVADTDPAPHAYPGAQGPLHAAVVSPDVPPNRPAMQSVHTPSPDTLYLPAGQMDAVALTDPAGQAYPAAHRPLHAGDVRPGTDPKVPIGQAAVHDEDVKPAVSPYRPGAQSVHEPWPPVLYLPGVHLVAVALVDPAGQA